MPDIDKSLNAAQRHGVRENLRRHSGQQGINQVLAVLTDSSVVSGVSVRALRSVLQQVGADSGLLEIVASDVQWAVCVAKAEAHVAFVKTAAGRQKMLFDNSLALVVHLMSAERASAVGLGGQARKTVSEVQARWVSACVGLDVLESIRERGFNTVVVSNQRTAAELGTQKDGIKKALDWAAAHGMMKRVSKRGVNWRWSLKTVIGEHRRIAEDRFGEVIVAVAGAMGAVSVPTENADNLPLIEEADPFWDDEFLQARKAKKAKLARLSSAKTPFAAAVVSAWEPTGIMAGLDPMVAPTVAADVLLSARNVFWERSGAGANPSVWLAMLAGALGIDGEVVGLPAAVMKAGRAKKVFGVDVLLRLNNGERFRDLVAELESAEGIERRSIRVQAWQEKSEAFAESRRAWDANKNLAEEAINELVREVGKVAKKSDGMDSQNAWLQNAHVAMGRRVPTMPVELASMVNKRLTRRLRANGYGANTSAKAAAHIVPVPASVSATSTAAASIVEIHTDMAVEVII